ncbi:MAG: alanine--tRNA ligase, partial [Clostridia bacterium]|nr:alanine--tRNA ligase [Clostridia bacterium]
ARKLCAMALFGEKYGDTVRVVKMGDKSVEFCGGTHLDNTAKAGPFRITSEFSVASGVRRIEAITGRAVLDQIEDMSGTLAKVSETLKTSQREVIKKAAGCMAELKELHQTVEKMQAKLRSGDMDRLLGDTKTVAGLKILTIIQQDISADELRKMGDFLRDRESAIVAVLAGIAEGKISILAVCGKDAVAKGVKAGDLIKTVTAVCGGSGGGKPDSAMGGGRDISKLDDAMAAAYDFVAQKAK